VSNDIESAAGVLESIRTEALQRLGIDASEVLTGIDDKAGDLLQSFDLLAQDADADVKLITAAFDSLLQRLDSPEEIEILKSSLSSVQNPAFDAARCHRRDRQAAGGSTASGGYRPPGG
jgi:hypothetical protein